MRGEIQQNKDRLIFQGITFVQAAGKRKHLMKKRANKATPEINQKINFKLR